MLEDRTGSDRHRLVGDGDEFVLHGLRPFVRQSLTAFEPFRGIGRYPPSARLARASLLFIQDRSRWSDRNAGGLFPDQRDSEQASETLLLRTGDRPECTGGSGFAAPWID